MQLRVLLYIKRRRIQNWKTVPENYTFDSQRIAVQGVLAVYLIFVESDIVGPGDECPQESGRQRCGPCNEGEEKWELFVNWSNAMFVSLRVGYKKKSIVATPSQENRSWFSLRLSPARLHGADVLQNSQKSSRRIDLQVSHTLSCVSRFQNQNESTHTNTVLLNCDSSSKDILLHICP